MVREGCDVRVVLSDGGAYTNPSASIASLEATGARTVRCANLMHGKFMVFRGVTVAGKKDQTIVADGSQNWTNSGLRRNDDSTFTLSTVTASSSRASRIRTLAVDYHRAWNAISAHSHTCG